MEINIFSKSALDILKEKATHHSSEIKRIEHQIEVEKKSFMETWIDIQKLLK